MAAVLRSWAVPRRVLLLSAVATVVLVAPLVAAFLVAGVPAAVGLGLGYLVSVRAAVNLRPGHALFLAVPAAMAGAVAVALRGQPLAAACFVALCCLLVAPTNGPTDALMMGVPSAVAVLVSAPGPYEPGPTALWMLAGGALMVGVGSRLQNPDERPIRVPEPVAWPHAIVMAATVGPAVYAVTLLGWPHGYWVALTLTVLLRPFEQETRSGSWQRVLGTVAGVLLALVLVTVLPLPAVAVALAGCFTLDLAYAMVGDHARQLGFLAPAAVLLGSAGSPGVIAAEPALDTVAAALLVVAVAVSLAWFGSPRRSTARESGHTG